MQRSGPQKPWGENMGSKLKKTTRPEYSHPQPKTGCGMAHLATLPPPAPVTILCEQARRRLMIWSKHAQSLLHPYEYQGCGTEELFLPTFFFPPASCPHVWRGGERWVSADAPLIPSLLKRYLVGEGGLLWGIPPPHFPDPKQYPPRWWVGFITPPHVFHMFHPPPPKKNLRAISRLG